MKSKNLCNSLYCDIFTLLLWSGTEPAISEICLFYSYTFVQTHRIYNTMNEV